MAIKQAADSVQEASDRFYDALTQMANGDAKPMRKLWVHGDDVTTMHPIGGREMGWSEVKQSWEMVADVAEGGEVTPSNRFINVMGDVAYELVTESVTMTLAGQTIESEYRATNVYHLVKDEWKLVHHHADTDPEFIELVQSLGPE